MLNGQTDTQNHRNPRIAYNRIKHRVEIKNRFKKEAKINILP